MNHTAEKHFVPLHDSLLGNVDADGPPWKVGDEPSSSRHDTWLLSFIDILALLLTLFVLLLAFQDREMKSADTEIPATREPSPDFDYALDAWGLLFRQQALILADFTVSEEFAPDDQGMLSADTGTVRAEPGESGEQAESVKQLPEESRAVSVSDKAISEDELIQAQEEIVEVSSLAVPATNEATGSPDNAVQVLLEVIESGELRDRVEVVVHPGEVNLEISDSILFDRASAALTNEGLTLLKDLAEALSEQPYTLSVEGHTDNIPIETARYPSNWELSSARAAVVTRKLIEQGIAPDKVRAIGYGATRPLADNRTPQGRARNRRVSFILQVDVKEDDQGNPALSPEHKA